MGPPMIDVTVKLASLKKDVLVAVPDDGDLATAFNEASVFVKGLEANSKIRDLEQGVDPRGATHEVVKDRDGYRLRRFRFS